MRGDGHAFRIYTSHGRRPAPLFTVLVGYETLHGRIVDWPTAPC